MINTQTQDLILKIVQIVSLLTGVALTAYNFFSFKVVKSGYYFQDDNQIWLAAGVTLITVSYIIRNWKNM